MRSKYIDENTIRKLRSVVGEEKWLPLRISLETGLRIGDVVDLIFGQVHRKGKDYYITATSSKTKKTDDFKISATLYNTLYSIKRENCASRLDFIFNSYGESGHLTRQAVWSRMKKAAAELGISGDGISPHSLRKCFAVALMHEEGLAAVRRALQHSNDAVTRIYAYADTVLAFDTDEPIRWRDVELLVDYIISRLRGEIPKNT